MSCTFAMGLHVQAVLVNQLWGVGLLITAFLKKKKKKENLLEEIAREVEFDWLNLP